MFDASMGRHCKHSCVFSASILSQRGVSMLSMRKPYDLTTRGGRVEFALDESGHTPTSTAKKIGCKPQAISQWISRPDTNIKNPLLFKFADLTGFEARWIATGEGPQRSVGATEGLYVTDPKIARIAQTLLLAQEEGKEYLVDKTQKDIDADTELIEQVTAHAKANDC